MIFRSKSRSTALFEPKMIGHSLHTQLQKQQKEEKCMAKDKSTRLISTVKYLALLAGLAAVFSVKAETQAKKPNILVIFGDDIGQANISRLHAWVLLAIRRLTSIASAKRA